ncbi:MAG: DUF1345 domain-containing protein [Bacteroidia bacterium]|nr:DUF1345 domain-containing protein [Bacteroidia bacterium]
MHPVQRISISVVFAAVTFFLLPKDELGKLLLATICWIAFAGTYLLTSWIVMFNRTVENIRKKAKEDDGSKALVSVLVIISSFAAMFAVLLLIISTDSETKNHILFIPAAIVGMLASWAMVHTIFTFHYAHIYYDDANESDKKSAEGLDFPGDDEPDYLDFAYFSFGVGCTFQVADVSVTSPLTRRTVLMHSLLSFGLNTFVVALTINLVAGLGNP